MKNVPSETFESLVRIDSVVYWRFKKHCADNGLIIAGIVSRLVAEYLENPARFKAGRFVKQLEGKPAKLPKRKPARKPNSKKK